MITLLVGVPGVGKSYVCSRLIDKYDYVSHDRFMKRHDEYVAEILSRAKQSEFVLCEAPFSMSETVGPLEASGHTVRPVFIIEEPVILAARYMKDRAKPIPKGHLTRQDTYLKRAIAGGHFFGTSEQVLEHLRGV